METEFTRQPALEQNLDLILYILHLQSRLEACNADKAALREWHGRFKAE